MKSFLSDSLSIPFSSPFGFYPFPRCPTFLLLLDTCRHHYKSTVPAHVSAIPFCLFFALLHFYKYILIEVEHPVPQGPILKNSSPDHLHIASVNQPASFAKEKSFTYFFGLHPVTTICITNSYDLLFPSKGFMNVSLCRCSLSDQDNESGIVLWHSEAASVSVEC